MVRLWPQLEGQQVNIENDIRSRNQNLRPINSTSEQITSKLGHKYGGMAVDCVVEFEMYCVTCCEALTLSYIQESSPCDPLPLVHHNWSAQNPSGLQPSQPGLHENYVSFSMLKSPKTFLLQLIETGHKKECPCTKKPNKQNGAVKDM